MIADLELGEDVQDVPEAAPAQPRASDSDVAALALEIIRQFGWAGGIYLCSYYAQQEQQGGNFEAEIYWMRVLVSIVSLRDLPSAWWRVPGAITH